MGALDSIAVRALSQLPETEGSAPSLTHDTASPNSPTSQAQYTPQSPNFDDAALVDAANQSNTPDPISIGSPVYHPPHGLNAIPKTTIESNTEPCYGTAMAHYRPSMLVALLDHHFPGRSDSYDEMLDLGIATSHYIKKLTAIYRMDDTLGDPESRIVTMLESIMHEWHAVRRTEINELAKLRFLEFKLKLRLHDLGYEAELARSY
ncbi:hypothetical protein BGZ61DRAFT_450425 [Ilyonectria robusta]|uniref:uncharacterized protein n=1 Tax=Ilyonectria robusta TaxID=1079257 RepID=UPI001E8D2CA5|nr:uncharacterized protein BGZ61DRAFT_450425 [Ilyonectria robusta]KAH8706742.1 hypothetical protein BGZ61DRAFT_450425 [Ilyonectria robusta]